MSSFEKEVLNVAPFSLLQEEEKFFIELSESEEDTREITEAIVPVLQLLKPGATLANIYIELWRSGVSRPARRMVQALKIAYEEGLIGNPRFISFFESIKSDYEWPKNFLLTLIVEIFRFRTPSGNAKNPLMAWVLFVVLMGFTLRALLRVGELGIDLLGFENLIRASATATGMSLAYFALAASVSKIFTSLWQATLIWLYSGRTQSLVLEIQPIGVGVELRELGKYRDRKSSEVIFLLTGVFAPVLALWLLVPQMVGAPEGHLAALILGFYFAFFVQTSPFVASVVTAGLRFIFNKWDEEKREDTESAISNIHVGLSFLWVVGFGIWLSAFVMALYGLILQGAQLGGMQAVFLGLVTMAFLSLVADILGSISYKNLAALGSLRNLWKIRGGSSRILNAHEAEDLLESRSFIKELPLIRFLSDQTRKQILQLAHVRQYREGTRICRQGDLDRSLFVLLSGEVRLARKEGKKRVALGSIAEGSVFGEVGFFLGNPRTADVTAASNTVVLVIEHSPMLSDLSDEKAKTMRNLIWTFQAFATGEIFRSVPTEAYDFLIKHGAFRELAPGTTLFKEEEIGHTAAFLIDGKVGIFRNGKPVREMSRGDVIGEIALLNRDSRRTATVVAQTPLLIFEMTRDQFFQMLSENLILASIVEKAGAARIQSDRAQLAD